MKKLLSPRETESILQVVPMTRQRYWRLGLLVPATVNGRGATGYHRHEVETMLEKIHIAASVRGKPGRKPGRKPRPAAATTAPQSNAAIK